MAAFYRDAIAGTLEPVYNNMADLPGLQDQPTPYLPAEMIRRYGGAIGWPRLWQGF